jgi:hypothetical protein
MLIGLGEALITTLVVAAVARVRPELLEERTARDVPMGYVGLAVQGMLISLGLAVFVAPFACGWPDGLERVARALGFESRVAEQAFVPSPLPDYAVPGVRSAVSSTAIAGGIGTGMAFVLGYVLARVLTSGGGSGGNSRMGRDSCCVPPPA